MDFFRLDEISPEAVAEPVLKTPLLIQMIDSSIINSLFKLCESSATQQQQGVLNLQSLHVQTQYGGKIFAWSRYDGRIFVREGRPDICHELYSWGKKWLVEKYQLSMYDNCGEFEPFSTCGEISDVST